jgi:chromosome segregation ATPase
MDANSQSAQGKSQSATWLVTMIGSSLIAVAILGGPVNGLLQLRAFDVELQSWQSTSAERDSAVVRHERDIEVSDSRLVALQQQINSEQAVIAELKVESDRLKGDRDQMLLELAGSRKAEELARQTVVAAQSDRDAAVKIAAAAETAKGVVEARTGELQSRETELMQTIATLQIQLDALTKQVANETTNLATINAEQETARKRTAAAEQSVVDASKELAKLQTNIASAATDLKKAVTELGSTVRDRESLLVEIAKLKRTTTSQQETITELEMRRTSIEAALAEMVVNQNAVASLRVERKQAEADTKVAKADFVAATTELKTAEQQLDTTRRAVISSQTKLLELQSDVTKTADEFQTVVTNHGKVLRDRETILGELRTAKEQLVAIKLTEEKVATSVSDLRKTLAQLQSDQIERADEFKKLEVGIARLRKTLTELTSETSQPGAAKSELKDSSVASGQSDSTNESAKPGISPPDEASPDSKVPQSSSGNKENPESSTEVSESPPSVGTDGKDTP